MQFGEALAEAESHALLSQAVDGGVTAFDVAEMYPVPPAADTSGASERILGTWLRTRRREDYQIISKVAGPGSMPWLRGGPARLDGRALTAALDGSLVRLGVDCVDLFLLHWPDRCAVAWWWDAVAVHGGMRVAARTPRRASPRPPVSRPLQLCPHVWQGRL